MITVEVNPSPAVREMGQARGVYTFMARLRWTPAVAAGYAAAIPVYLALNCRAF